MIRESGIPEVHVRINGSYRIWEKEGKILPANVEVNIFGPGEEGYYRV